MNLSGTCSWAPGREGEPSRVSTGPVTCVVLRIVELRKAFRAVRTSTTMYGAKCRSELCRNCVRSPRKHPQIPTFTGSHREAFWGGKSLNRLREEVIQHHSVSVAGFVFQACSIDHSDISPFRINELRSVWTSLSQNPPSTRNVPRCDLYSAVCGRPETERRTKLCKTS